MSEEKPTIPRVSIATYRGNTSEKTGCEFTEDSGPLKCSHAALSVPIPTSQSRCTHNKDKCGTHTNTGCSQELFLLFFLLRCHIYLVLWHCFGLSQYLQLLPLYSMLRSRLWPASWMFTFFPKANTMCISCLNNPSQL